MYRFIKAEEKITDSYGMTFIESPRKIRQQRFETKYKFLCECEACKMDYPAFQDLEKELPEESIRLVESNFKEIDRSLQENNPIAAIEMTKQLYNCLGNITYLHAAKKRTRILLGTCCRMAFSVQ